MSVDDAVLPEPIELPPVDPEEAAALPLDGAVAVALPLEGLAAVEPVVPVPLLPIVVEPPAVPERVPVEAVLPVPAPAGPRPLAACPVGAVVADRFVPPTLFVCMEDAPLC